MQPITVPIKSEIISFLSNVPFFNNLSHIISLAIPIIIVINAEVIIGINKHSNDDIIELHIICNSPSLPKYLYILSIITNKLYMSK